MDFSICSKVLTAANINSSSSPAAGDFFFPNETSVWDAPLRSKEISSERWAELLSGRNLGAKSWCARGVFLSARVFVGPTGWLGLFLFFGACGGLLSLFPNETSVWDAPLSSKEISR